MFVLSLEPPQPWAWHVCRQSYANPVVNPRCVLAAGAFLGRHIWSMLQHHEKIACDSPGLHSPPKLVFTGQESRSFLAVQYHAWALHVGTEMLLAFVTFCKRQLELCCQFTQAWWKEYKSHTQNSTGARKVKVLSSVPHLKINRSTSVVGAKKEKYLPFSY